MTTSDKKARHKRGHTFMGHGRVGKHRKHPGGRGLAGGQHHHRVLMDRFHPGYFGKVGMRTFGAGRHKNADHVAATNVDRLWHIAGDEALKAAQKSDKKQAVVLDLTSRGIHKVLGKGRLPKLPLIVKARFVSKLAEEKIRAAGGAVVLTA